MRIAVASDKDMVSQHFGHCEGFMLYDLDNGCIAEEEFVANPGHKPGFLPVFLHKQDVKVVISGGMGAGAIAIFNENGVDVITGAAGKARDNAEKFAKGELQSSGSACEHHEHHDACGHE